MTLDLYYSNFTNVGDALTQMYQTFLSDDSIKKPSKTENGAIVNLENEVQKHYSPPDRLSLPPNCKSEGPQIRIVYKAPIRSASVKLSNGNPESNHRASQKSQQKSPRTPPESPTKTSPQEIKNSPRDLRAKKSVSPRNEINDTNINAASSARREILPDTTRGEQTLALTTNSSNPNIPSSGEDVNILKQQNSRSSSLSASTKTRLSSTSKVYFREENVENLSWDNSSTSFDENPDDLTSPKENPYSSSFLNFLGNN